MSSAHMGPHFELYRSSLPLKHFSIQVIDAQTTESSTIHPVSGKLRKTVFGFLLKALRRVLPENLSSTYTSILTLEHLHFYTYNGTVVSKNIYTSILTMTLKYPSESLQV